MTGQDFVTMIYGEVLDFGNLDANELLLSAGFGSKQASLGEVTFRGTLTIGKGDSLNRHAEADAEYRGLGEA